MIDGKDCKICRSNRNLEAHHLSYNPELIVYLCGYCHRFLHRLPFYSESQLKEFQLWVKEYGHLWINGKQQYSKSPHAKKYLHDYRRTHLELYRKGSEKYRLKNKNNPEYKTLRIKYQKEYYQRHKDVLKADARARYHRRKSND